MLDTSRYRKTNEVSPYPWRFRNNIINHHVFAANKMPHSNTSCRCLVLSTIVE